MQQALQGITALEWGKFKGLVVELTYITMQNRDAYDGEKVKMNVQIATLRSYTDAHEGLERHERDVRGVEQHDASSTMSRASARETSSAPSSTTLCAPRWVPASRRRAARR